MKNEFINRLTMFQTSLGILQDPARISVWSQKDPKAFTAKVADTSAAVDDLAAFCQQQGTRILASKVESKQTAGFPREPLLKTTRLACFTDLGT
jgi:hypothetical protein